VDDAPAAHRLRPWTTRRCAAELPTAATFDHMTTAFNDLKNKRRNDNKSTGNIPS